MIIRLLFQVERLRKESNQVPPKLFLVLNSDDSNAAMCVPFEKGLALTGNMGHGSTWRDCFDREVHTNATKYDLKVMRSQSDDPALQIHLALERDVSCHSRCQETRTTLPSSIAFHDLSLIVVGATRTFMIRDIASELPMKLCIGEQC